MSNEINFFNESVEEIVRDRLPAPSKVAAALQAMPKSEAKERVRQETKRIMEAALFSSPEALPLSKLRDVVSDYQPIKEKQLSLWLKEMNTEYEEAGRAFEIVEVADGFLLQTKKEFGPYLQTLHHGRAADALSPASSEVLAIIAYKQPITRPAIEAIRGVDSSGCVQALLERGLIECVGKLEAPGRPGLYGTTNRFLQHFGLKEVSELPTVNL